MSQCTLVKIDVEGLEPEVLAGAVNLIRVDRPVVVAECNSVSAGLALLRCTDDWDGYQPYLVSNRAFNAGNFNRLSKNLFPGAWESSVVFLPNERASRLPREHEGLRIFPIGGTEEFLEAFVSGIEASWSESLALMHSDLDQARQDLALDLEDLLRSQLPGGISECSGDPRSQVTACERGVGVSQQTRG